MSSNSSQSPKSRKSPKNQIPSLKHFAASKLSPSQHRNVPIDLAIVESEVAKVGRLREENKRDALIKERNRARTAFNLGLQDLQDFQYNDSLDEDKLDQHLAFMKQSIKNYFKFINKLKPVESLLAMKSKMAIENLHKRVVYGPHNKT